MVKMMRSPQRYQLAGEPDAWDGRASSQGQGGYGLVDPYRPITPATSQRHNAQRIIPRAPAPYQSRGVARDAGTEDFRALAQTIERRRILSAKADPMTSSMASSRVSPKPNRTPVRPIAERWQSDDYARSQRPTRQHTRPRTPEPTPRTPLKPSATTDSPNRAELQEIARLEGVLDEVLRRLQALERANEQRPAQRTARPSSPSRERSSWRDDLPSRAEAAPARERPARASTNAQARVDEDHASRPRRLFRR